MLVRPGIRIFMTIKLLRVRGVFFLFLLLLLLFFSTPLIERECLSKRRQSCVIVVIVVIAETSQPAKRERDFPGSSL